MSYHEPVLLQETIDGLLVSKGKRFIDATLGGAGHTKRMVDLGAEVLGIDVDLEAIAYVTKKLEDGLSKIENAGSWKIVQGNFRDIDTIAREEAFYPVDGILFDLGVSSHQLDEEERGFSYKFAAAPFDLRLNQKEGVPASEIINHESEEQLKKIIGVFGEEESCGVIAHALVHSRVKKPIRTTGDVLEIIGDIKGERNQYKSASKVFQGFRIYVNDELNALKIGLEKGVRLVKPGGRIAVISFHSLEDRIVKQFFQKKGLTIITKKPITAGVEEQQKNRRSRSAKLRIGEIL
jgi:16S rRNA (cytosine1402-N4)-methyltransferase